LTDTTRTDGGTVGAGADGIAAHVTQNRIGAVAVRHNLQIPPRWDLSQERAFIENLLNTRLAAFLVFFGIINAGGWSVSSHPYLQAIILTIGAGITWALTYLIGREQAKLDAILKILMTDPEHPAAVVNAMMGRAPDGRWIAGYILPAACAAVVTLAAALGWTGHLPD
jgi:hypothetical protein